jgi:hypothetical protein
MRMSLENWAERGWLRREPTSPGEIKDLLGVRRQLLFPLALTHQNCY